MIILHINSGTNVSKIDKYIKNGSHVFILIFMEGCGPCNATRPEWEKLESALKDQYAHNNKIVVIDVNKDYLSDIKYIGEVDGFPTMKYIGNKGNIIESYENSSIKKKDRSVSSFINWIESKLNNVVSTVPTSSPHNVYKRIANKNKTYKPHHKKSSHKKSSHKKSRKHRKNHNKGLRGGKWSKKYKASINCNNPKGFSQKQYCKYGR